MFTFILLLRFDSYHCHNFTMLYYCKYGCYTLDHYHSFSIYTHTPAITLPQVLDAPIAQDLDELFFICASFLRSGGKQFLKHDQQDICKVNLRITLPVSSP